MSEQEVGDIDPNADRCPWCGGPRIWRGHHAAAQHPDEWAAFKDYYMRNTNTSVTWEEPGETP